MSVVSEKLNLKADIEIVKRYPLKYENLTLNEIKYTYNDNEIVNYMCFVLDVKVLDYKNSVFKFKLKEINTSKEFIASSFYQPFLLRSLLKGNTYFFKLKYRANFKDFTILGHLKDNNIYVKNKLRPIYRLPKGLSQSQFLTKLNKLVLSNKYLLENEIPSVFETKHKLMNANDMYKYIHFPSLISKEENDKSKMAIKQIRYIEALKYATLMELNRDISLKSKRKSMVNLSKDKLIDFDNIVKESNISLYKDQKAALEDIFNDLNKTSTMYRILIGDVGSGKTIVSCGATYLNYLRNGQSVIMVPTFTLASQHYKYFSNIFKNTDIKLCLLTNSLTAKQKKETLEKIESHYYDIIIGTTSVLSDKLKYANLTMAIIDEEQKFGVKQRNELLRNNNNVDLLFMSATPIPRTYSQIIYADLDESRLNGIPNKIRQVETYFTNSKNKNIFTHVSNALANDQLVFIIVPRIESKSQMSTAFDIYQQYESMYKGKCQLITGRIKKEEQDKIMKNFKNHIKPLLISTSIIEVGLDVKDASLMIIYEANYFGLSTLHQFRGRIGRDGQKGTCILVYDKDDTKAIEKLKILTKCSNGEELAEFDIKARGYGYIAGDEQTGESPLGVADFLTDTSVFNLAKSDAKLIVNNRDNNKEYSYFIKLITWNDPTKNSY